MIGTFSFLEAFSLRFLSSWPSHVVRQIYPWRLGMMEIFLLFLHPWCVSISILCFGSSRSMSPREPSLLISGNSSFLTWTPCMYAHPWIPCFDNRFLWSFSRFPCWAPSVSAVSHHWRILHKPMLVISTSHALFLSNIAQYMQSFVSMVLCGIPFGWLSKALLQLVIPTRCSQTL